MYSINVCVAFDVDFNKKKLPINSPTEKQLADFF